ncbi:hypothetical protein XH99_28955 [Bradyrhizobium nanningense]|uniref:Uncharacterized protein n=1 Tax=Bradyrhizobium nanningense TaxID=1325118 RepID=A0A4V1L1C0_9BRAD|nr:hypothetical protein XH99_28955 [Bradyrhizobium nanningense]RXH29325.1 hypothetical protein XH84_22845 [Bradyrhizobium nanningense]
MRATAYTIRDGKGLGRAAQSNRDHIPQIFLEYRTIGKYCVLVLLAHPSPMRKQGSVVDPAIQLLPLTSFLARLRQLFIRRSTAK